MSRPPADRPRVAVTGLGAMSALGLGVTPFWDSLVAGRSGIATITLTGGGDVVSAPAGAVRDFDPASYFADNELELLDRFAQFALVATREAVADAGLTLPGATPVRVGVAIGTGLGGATSDNAAHIRVYAERKRVPPLTIPRLMYNAAASHVSMALGLHGPTLCFATACASGAHAIGEAAEIIRAGRADVMIAGAADAPLAHGVLRAWEALRVLAPADGNPAAACRPFSRDRQGLVLAEGAGIVVLERWDQAERRGARIYAELAGYSATADGQHVTQPGTAAPVAAIELALADGRLLPSAIDYVNAHGTGTRLNDATETRVLKRAFGDHARTLAISSTKSMHGHAMGASAALEFIVCVLAVNRGIVPPTANYTEPDPKCDLDYVPNVARRLEVHAAISNSFAFGGLNAVLALKRASDHRAQ